MPCFSDGDVTQRQYIHKPCSITKRSSSLSSMSKVDLVKYATEHNTASFALAFKQTSCTCWDQQRLGVSYMSKCLCSRNTFYCLYNFLFFFKFCHTFSFWVVIIWDSEGCKKLSPWVLSHFFFIVLSQLDKNSLVVQKVLIEEKNVDTIAFFFS